MRHLVLEVVDVAAAQRWLGATVTGGEGVPAITTEVDWTGPAKPSSNFNIGFTFQGLRALGVPAASLATFPGEFSEGMAARALKLGDIGPSAPEHWAAPFSTPAIVHLVATIHADEVAELDRVEQQVVAAGDGNAFRLHVARDGWNFDNDFVHFGYRDSISEPRFAGIHDPDQRPDAQPLSPIGAMLLGYPTEYEGLLWTVPTPDSLGINGTFNAFRILEQDVVGFETYLTEAATLLMTHPLGEELLPSDKVPSFGPGFTRHAALREMVAAKMCGRWRNGVPLALSPYTPNPDVAVSLTDFDYSGGLKCPFGAHIRRTNPRGGTIASSAPRATRGGSSGAAFPMALPMIRNSPISRSADCSGISSAPTSARNSRRWRATG